MDNSISIILLTLGAIADTIAILGFVSLNNKGTHAFSFGILNALNKKFYAYLLASASWVLLVQVWHLGFTPFGSYLTERELGKLLAVTLSFPVIIAFIYSVNIMTNNEKT